MRKTKILTGILQLLKKIIFTLLGLAGIYLLAAIILSVVPVHSPDADCTPESEVFITTNGVHLDIVLPVQNMKKSFLSKLDIPGETKFVSFGWGDKNFYVNTPEWSDLTFPVAFKALFLKSESAMHVTRYQRTYTNWGKVELCRHQIDSLNSYIENSFEKTETGGLQKMDYPGYTDDDNFYEAKGYFTLFKTCNVWTNNALKKIEVTTSVWSPFDFGVLYHLPD